MRKSKLNTPSERSKIEEDLKMMKAALAGKALEGRCNIVFQKYKAGTDYVKKFWIKFAFLF